MDIACLLESALLATDGAVRAQAERQLEELAASSFSQYLVFLSDVLINGDAKPEVRMLAALGMKNQLTAKDSRVVAAQQNKWLALDQATKDKIKAAALQVLLSNDERMVSSISQLVSAIGTIELPRGEWPVLIPTIIENTKTEKPTQVKRACLLAIGYICENSDANDPQIIAQSNGILIAIVQGVQLSEPSPLVRLAALNSLINSLLFIKQNFQREGERNFIMQVVCEATQATDSQIQAAAFACLTRIVQQYYNHMSLYMEKALYVLSILGMQSADDKVACTAIEFWATICEEEFEIALQLHEAVERGENGNLELQSYNFALLATNDVLPVLLTLLTKQNEDPEDDDWSVAMAAGSCLQMFAQATGMYVVEPTLKFFAANIDSQEWRNREAAVMAFGSILEGPELDQLTSPIQEALQPILRLINDPTLQVQETTAWCLGKITEIALPAINLATDLEPLLQALLVGLNASNRVSVNACWALINILEQICSDAPQQNTSIMSRYYETFVPALIQLTNKEDNENNSRASAYEALSSFVTYSAADTMNIIQNIAMEVLNRLDATISMQLQAYNVESKTALEELQINILSLLTNIIRRLSLDVEGAADKLMTMFIKLLDAQQPNALIEEDIFLAISAVSSAVGPSFLKYMDLFIPYLTKALTNVESPTCITAVGLVADLAQSLGAAIGPYLNGLMDIMGVNLNSNLVKRELKPAILSCFGDLAAVGEPFFPYMEVVMQICSQLTNTVPEDNSYESMDYVVALKEAVLDCYVGIVGSLSDKPELLYNFLGPIFQLIQQIAGDIELSMNESTARSAVGLLGDIAAMYQDGQLKNFYEQDWVTTFIKKTRGNITFSQQTKDAARWARDRQKRQVG